MVDAVPADFDPDFYLEMYSDVREAKVDPVEHYLVYGRKERRYFSAERLAVDIETVRDSGEFDENIYEIDPDADMDPIDHYLLYHLSAPNEDFDWDFFLTYYQDTLATGEHPFVFYCRYRSVRWIYGNAKSVESHRETIANSSLFDAAFYARHHLKNRGNVDPATHYLTEGFRALASPSAAMDGTGYALAYPDLVKAAVNPILHWEQHGRHENRAALGTKNIHVQRGERPRDRSLRTIILTSHEASRTGAPVVVLSLLRYLSTRFNIIVIAERGGELAEHFRKLSVAYVETGYFPQHLQAAVARIVADFKPEVAVLNSIVSTYNISAYTSAGLGIVTLIHDFATYVRPTHRVGQALLLSDEVIFPARIVRDSALDALRSIDVSSVLGNIHVRPQGRSLLPPKVHKPLDGKARSAIKRLAAIKAEGTALVIGAGYVQLRKGVDIFIESARQTVRSQADVHFVWVGGGYDPDHDAALSVYLRDQILKSGLKDHVTFVPELDDLQDLFELGSLFLLSSRLDPFPNVALDAMASGMPVVCFEGSTGIAELAQIFPALVHVVDYQDCAAASGTIRALIASRPEGFAKEHADYLSWSDFGHYADFVMEKIDAAAAKREQRQIIAEELVEDDVLDVATFERTTPSWLKQPEIGLGATYCSIAGVAASLISVGYDQSLIAPGRLTTPKGEAWKTASFRVAYAQDVAPKPTQTPVFTVVRDETEAHRVAATIFGSPNQARFYVILSITKDEERPRIETILGRLPDVVLLEPGRAQNGLELPEDIWTGVLLVPSQDNTPMPWSAPQAVVTSADIKMLVSEIAALPTDPAMPTDDEMPSHLSNIPVQLIATDRIWIRGFDQTELVRLLFSSCSSPAPSPRKLVADIARMLDVANGGIAMLGTEPICGRWHGEILSGVSREIDPV